ATDIAGLNNRAFPIVYSIACQNARIRNNDSIAETWMSRAGAGSVAHWGASVNSYTSENHERSKGIFRALYQNGFTRLAPALAEAERISHASTGGGSSWDNNTFCYLLLGDPELTVRRKSVSGFKITASLTNLLSGAVVLLQGGQTEPISAALVNVLLADGRSLNGFSRADGSFLLPALKSDDIAEITVHADGYPGTRIGGVRAPLIDPKPEFSARDGFRFKIRGDLRTYAIQISLDLKEWKTIQTFTAAEFEYVDRAALSEIRQFYRVIPLD
ncbi:MAG: C25 family cysteine peptidase, partial [Limisphaerales bacterium]